MRNSIFPEQVQHLDRDLVVAPLKWTWPPPFLCWPFSRQCCQALAWLERGARKCQALPLLVGKDPSTSSFYGAQQRFKNKNIDKDEIEEDKGKEGRLI
jgi:hypothetical protein